MLRLPADEVSAMLERWKTLLEGVQKSGPTTAASESALATPPQTTHEESEPPVPAPILERTDASITFAVDDVTPASDPLWTSTLGESAEIRSDASILFMPDSNASAIAPEGYIGKALPGEPRQPYRTAMHRLATLPAGMSVAKQLAKSQTFLHPLMQAVHVAFSQHRPLVFTPDAIWLTLVQGFGHHVHENAEALRGRLVRHEGKKKLCFEIDEVKPELWPQFISQFSALIRENSDPVLHETLLCDFSTTTSAIRTAFEVALMDTYQRYFDYGMMCVCGIPRITVEGTAEDWQRMRGRIEVLATYDLQWWTSRVAPILDQFVATANGNPDRAFWQAIYKPQKSYAAELASGWIADLFPYLFSAPRFAPGKARLDEGPGRSLCDSAACYRNHVLAQPRTHWLLPTTASPMAGNGVNLKRFPSGISRAPVTIELRNRSTVNFEVMGGFLGTAQRPKDLALAPIITWALVQGSKSA